MSFRTKTNDECTDVLLRYIGENPDCTIEEISAGTGIEVQNCRRILLGRPDLPLPVGLVKSSLVVAVPGVSEHGRLNWIFRINLM